MSNNEVTERMLELENYFLSLPHGEVNNAVWTADLDISEIATYGSIQLIRICIERIMRGDFNNLSTYAKGRVFLFKGELAKAQQAFETSVEQGFEVSKSRINLGSTLARLGEFQSAIEQWEIAEAMGDHLAGINIFTGYLGLNEAEKANQQLEKMAKSGETGLETIFQHALLNIRTNDSLVWFLMRFLSEQNYVPALEWLLQAYEYHGSSKEFEQIMEQARRLGYSGFENGKLTGES